MREIEPQALLDDGALPGAQEAALAGVADCTLLQIRRWLRNRRVTARARWRGRDVALKLFAADARGERDFRHEVAMLRRLGEAGLAPALELTGRAGPCGLVAMTWVRGETALERYARETTPQTMIHELCALTARLHALGLSQQDSHLGNYLYADARWFVLDAGGCRRVRDSERARLRSASRLLAQFDARDVVDFAGYARSLGIASAADRLRRAWRRALRARLRAIHRKAGRECTEFRALVDGAGGRGLCRRERYDTASALLRTGLAEPGAGDALLKDGNSTTVYRVAREDGDFVVKRYNNKSLWHGIRRRLRASRARRSWRNGAVLRALGVRTPRPLLFFEERPALAAGRAWLVTDYSDGVPLSTLSQDALREHELAAPLAALMRVLAEAGVRHGDLKASNILLHEGELVLIDLDGMTLERAAPGRLAARADVRRLLRNWEGTPFGERLEQCIAEEKRA